MLILSLSLFQLVILFIFLTLSIFCRPIIKTFFFHLIERTLLDRLFEDMVTQYGGHNLKYLWKKMFDELLKFQAPLVGGIAVHIPFLLKNSMDAAERITKFRSTETIVSKLKIE